MRLDPTRSRTKPAQSPPSRERRARRRLRASRPKSAFDPATLPPIESITADSDIRAFLQSGVPADLTKAALRRVWTTDPAIRDFIGIAENQWDFTDPTAMPGFGPLEATDDVARACRPGDGETGAGVRTERRSGRSARAGCRLDIGCGRQPAAEAALASSWHASRKRAAAERREFCRFSRTTKQFS